MTCPLRARELLLLGFVLLPCAAALAEVRSFQKSLPADSGGVLLVRSDVGNIYVTSAAVGEVSVVAQIEGTARDVAGFMIDAIVVNGRIEVTGKAAKPGWLRWGLQPLRVTYTVSVPENFHLDLRTAGGDIAVGNVRGELVVRTSGGDIELNDVGGPIVATTSGGDIEIEHATGKLSARTSGGDILVAGIRGDAEVRTSGGDIRIANIAGRAVAKTSGGDIALEVTNEQQGAVVETSGGNINILQAAAVRTTIDAATSGGSVRINLPTVAQERIKGGKFRGPINGGGPEIHARTFGGSIWIRALKE